MIAIKQTFTKQTIYLDGANFQDCSFTECDMVLTGLISCTLNGCRFSNCKWNFAGPALSALQFLQALYAMGGDARNLVEETFNTIRGNKPFTNGDVGA